MENSTISKTVRLASSRLKNLVSERDSLSSKIAEWESRYQEQEKQAKSLRLAMALVLDEDALRAINEKQAALSGQDLSVVEKAMELDLLNKEASIGLGTTEGHYRNGVSGDDLISYLTRWSRSKS